MSSPVRQPISVNINIDTDSYTIPDTILGSRRPIKVIVIGFGFSGINISYILGRQTKNGNITLQFYEKNPELGGTWFENTYPGCACDIPIVNYIPILMASESGVDKLKEILAYLHDAVSHHNLDSDVKLNHQTTPAPAFVEQTGSITANTPKSSKEKRSLEKVLVKLDPTFSNSTCPATSSSGRWAKPLMIRTTRSPPTKITIINGLNPFKVQPPRSVKKLKPTATLISSVRLKDVREVKAGLKDAVSAPPIVTQRNKAEEMEKEESEYETDNPKCMVVRMRQI
ncbi:hypothetical protein F4813DRAFT_386263 [Daldinia decipiens]|uniref:uncharacterized protein n=1 Tax=Daldinia decipiens TaxID=326647 RepID=UPI0020C4F37D|nr:uncharacterized protein F4813DRAFT_386263 [Daldinia decipiens]KAI1660853.1 hypothetical protein F4813DRAFT_386263 [Daldinia decipiens]